MSEQLPKSTQTGTHDDHHYDDPHGHEHDYHDHGHGHGHNHEVSANANFRLMGFVLTLLTLYTLSEVVIGKLIGSLALLSDAAHMGTDIAALIASMVAVKWSMRPADRHFTYGYKRLSVIAGLFNSALLIGLAIPLLIEAFGRLVHPQDINPAPMFWTAIAGIVVNVVAVLLFNKANREDMAVEGAYKHMVSDLYAFIGTAVAAIVIWVGAHGWLGPFGFIAGWADTIASIAVAVQMVRSGIPLCIRSAKVLLLATPEGFDVEQFNSRLMSLKGFHRLLALNAFEHVPGDNILLVHVSVTDDTDCDMFQDWVTELADTAGFRNNHIMVDRQKEGKQPHKH